jgi:membrane fusion protein (multidrug efflux system)
VNYNVKGEPFVWVVDAESKASMRPVVLDRAISDKWLVSSGLAEGERIIVDGLQRVRHGVQVTVSGNSGAAKSDPATAKAN